MKFEKDIECIIDELVDTYHNISKEDLIIQIENLRKSIIREVKDFDVNKEYYEVYSTFRESVCEEYLFLFTNILDIVARIIINDIYLKYDSVEQIKINFEPIKNASSSKRKHFEVASEIVQSTLKKYFINPKSNKKILDYIDELLPDKYTKAKDIDFVVWYFLVCIVVIS